MGSTVRKSDKWEPMQPFSELVNYWKAHTPHRQFTAKKCQSVLYPDYIKQKAHMSHAWGCEQFHGEIAEQEDGGVGSSSAQCWWRSRSSRVRDLVPQPGTRISPGLTANLFMCWRANCYKSIRRRSQNYFFSPKEGEGRSKSICRVKAFPLPVAENGGCSLGYTTQTRL